MPSVVHANCQECARLFDANVAAERLVASLVEAQFESSSEENRLFRLIDEALETARRDMESATQALRAHRQEHGLIW